MTILYIFTTLFLSFWSSKLKKKLFFIFLSSYSFSQRYIYPIDTIDDQNILVLYQKNLEETHLYVYNIEEKTKIMATMKMYNPTGVVLNPSKKGFAFIDNGYIYFKEFIKRSSARIMFKKPFYNTHPIIWYNNERALFSAKYRGRFQIFDLNCKKKKIKLQKINSQKDLTFANKIDDLLFFVSYNLEKNKYSVKVQETKKRFKIYESSDFGLSFLKMINQEKGFFIRYPLSYEKHHKSINLEYYQISELGSNWVAKKLFDFNLPLKQLINSEYKLIESVLPFMPKIYENNIIYIDYKEPEMQVKSYNLTTSQNNLLGHNSLVLSPIMLNKCLIYGKDTNYGHNKAFYDLSKLTF